MRIPLYPILACVLAATSARAEVDATGAYTTAVNIDVPAYAHLTPAISLEYSSNGGNGPVGVGWSLGGISYITRSGPHHGAPTHTSDDVFLLDGVELVPCGAQTITSPSCFAGGTHSTQIESFLRVKQEGSTWQVTRTDGTTLTYLPQSVAAVNGVYRWAVSTIVDVHGNTVNYDYWCNGANGLPECYPQRIWYQGAEIRFYWGARPDVVSYATGNYVARTAQRLKSIDVTVDGQRARTYSLTYDTTHPQVPASVLTAVTRWGSDAVLDASGNVTAGSALPAETFAVDPASGQFDGVGAGPLFDFGPPIDHGGLPGAGDYTNDSTLAWDPEWDQQRWMPGDFDGDGKSDFIGTFYAHPAQGNDTFEIRTARIGRDGRYMVNPAQATTWQFFSPYIKDFYRVVTGDFNGDGKTDLALISHDPLGGPLLLHVALSRGDGTFDTSGATPLPGLTWDKRTRWFAGDIDGDGLTDLVSIQPHAAHSGAGFAHACVYTWRAKSDGSFRTMTTTETQLASKEAEDPLWTLGDADGDGMQDIMHVHVHTPDAAQPTDAHAVIETMRALGDGTFGPQPTFETGMPFAIVNYVPTVDMKISLAADLVQWGDFNGDGRTDAMIFGLMSHPSTLTISLTLETFLSGGAGRFTRFSEDTQQYPVGVNWVNQYSLLVYNDPLMVNRWLTADVNGDGATDLIAVGPASWKMTDTGAPSTVSYNVFLSRRDGYFLGPQLRTTNWHFDCYADRSTCLAGLMHDVFVGDVDGDGHDDVMYDGWSMTTDRTDFRVALSPRTGEAGSWLTVDLDGDGRTEQLYVAYTHPGVQIFSTLTSAGTTTPNLPQLDDADMRHWLVADVGSPGGGPDGKSDLVYVYNDETAGTLKVFTLLSKGDGTFLEKPPYETANFVGGDVQAWRLLDVDGDGLADVVRLRWNAGIEVDTLFSAGNGTIAREAHDTQYPTFASRDIRQWRPLDLDGDGAIDFVNIATDPNTGTQAVRTLRSRRDGSFLSRLPQTLTSNRPDTQRWMIAELDGDGRPDLVRLDWSATQLDLLVLTGQGDGSFAEATLPTTIATFSQFDEARTRMWLVGDLNGDGRDDLFQLGETPTTTAAYKVHANMLVNGRSGWTGERSADWNVPQPPGVASWHTTDFDSDGRVDVLAAFIDATPNGVSRVSLDAAASRRTYEHLVTQRNGLGATTAITYRSSAGHHAVMPVGAARQIVASVGFDIQPGTAGADGVAYDFSGARWSYGERRFLGFAQRVQTSNAQVTVNTYLQTRACAMAPETTTIADSNGGVFAADRLQYEDTSGQQAPWTCRPTVKTHDECERTKPCRSRTIETSYDRFNNVLRSDDHGDDEVTGDERSVSYGYRYNTTRYVVDRPNLEIRFDDGANALIAMHRYRYDGLPWLSVPTVGDLTTSLELDDVTGNYLETQLGYDGYGSVTSRIDPAGVTTTTTWDPEFHAHVTSRCDAVGCTTYDYDLALGVTLHTTDANGATTSTAYDQFGRANRTDFPDGGCAVYAYVDFGLPATQHVRTTACATTTTPDGPAGGLVVDRYFDGQARTWRLVRPGGAQRDVAYAGATDSVTYETAWYTGTPKAFTTTYYDARNRPHFIQHADGTARTIDYELGKIISTDELGNAIERTYDVFGRLVGTRETVTENGALAVHDTTQHYDGADRVIDVTDAANNVTTQTWDTRGDLITSHDPDRGDLAFEYDAGGRLVSRTDTANQRIAFEYDAAGRQIGKRTFDASGALVDEARWWWDVDPHGFVQGYSRGRVTRIETPGKATEDLWYDAMGRIKRHEQCVGTTCAASATVYDLLGRPQSITYPDALGHTSASSEVVQYTYDPVTGRMATMPGYVTSVGYDPSGRPTSLVYANKTRTVETYDPVRSWPSRITVVDSAKRVLFDAQYGHDARGAIDSLVEATPTKVAVQFSYDELGRLIELSGDRTQTLAYDAIGNIVESSTVGTYSYGDPRHVHAVTDAGGHPYSYDPNGNLLSGGDRTLTWTPDNRPASIDAGGQTTTFTYDARGQRIAKVSASGTTVSLGSLVEWSSQTGWTYNYYAAGQLVARRGVKLAFVHADIQGSTRALTDPLGKVVERYEYLPFGQSMLPPTVSNDRRWIGQRSDDETGLIYLNARYYDPMLGRFVSADSHVPSIDTPQGLNRYSYADNDPINARDPNGHEYETVIHGTDPDRLRAQFRKELALERLMERLSTGGVWGNLRKVMSPKYAAPAAQYWADMYVNAERNGDGWTQAGAAIMGTLASTCSDEKSADLTLKVLKTGWDLANIVEDLGELDHPDDVTGDKGAGNEVAPVENAGSQSSAEKVDREVVISKQDYPESAKHIEEAQAAGKPSVLTLDRAGADDRRRESLRGIPTKPGMDRDEYPFASTLEGGADAHVKHIPSSDNRGSGSYWGHQTRDLEDGARVRVIVK